MSPADIENKNVKTVSRDQLTAQGQSRGVQDPDLHRTPFYECHLANDARMVGFSGYAMPLFYRQYGAIIEHKQVRETGKAGIFDVSHMGQLRISGVGAAAWLQSLLTISASDLVPGQQAYALMTNEQGGIIDDVMLTCLTDQDFVLVVNASRLQTVLAHLHDSQPADIICEHCVERALLAVQGDAAADIVANLVDEGERDLIKTLPFLRGVVINLAGRAVWLSRSGYTGADGFEISLNAEDALPIATALLADERLMWCGLAARDSLRLEAGLCLYGQDINEKITPVEAGLSWAVSKTQRLAGGFPGSDKILGQLVAGVKEKRVGLRVCGQRGIRAGMFVYNTQGDPVGRVTSGSYSPILRRPIALAYVQLEYAAAGTDLVVGLRSGEQLIVEVYSLPFVPTTYYRSDKKVKKSI